MSRPRRARARASASPMRSVSTGACATRLLSRPPAGRGARRPGQGRREHPVAIGSRLRSPRWPGWREIAGSSRPSPATDRRSRRPWAAQLDEVLGGAGLALALLARIAALREEPRQVRLGDEHLARLRALVARDHAAALEHVYEPPGARVADAEPALDHRDRRGLRLHDQADRILQEVVLVRGELALALGLEVVPRLEQRVVEVRLALLRPVPDEARDLLLGHERALDPLQARGPDRPEQHVALAEQRLRPALVEDHPRVHLR